MLPDDHDKYHMEHDSDTNTVKIKENPGKQEKDEIYRTIFTVEKNLINKQRRKK